MQKALNVLIKPASGLCNMHCDYCFYCDEAGKRSTAQFGLMTTETLRQVIKKTLMQTTEQYTIAFQGGEPTLCGLAFFRTAIAYLEKYNKNHADICVALQTNGYGLTDEWAAFLSENHILTGVSVDGLPQIHDRYRRSAASAQATYDRIMQSIRLLEDHGVDYNVLTVVYRDVAEHIDEIYDKYRAKGWDYMQFITCLDPLGEPRGQKPYSLLPETFGAFLIRLFDRWYRDLIKGNAPYIRMFENYVGILLGFPPESCEQRGICGPQLVVEADGSVYPCDFYVLDEWRLGSFVTDRLDDIEKVRREKHFVDVSLRLPEKCKRCRWYRLCRGGCRRSRMSIADAAYPQYEENLNYFCTGYEMFFEACIDRLEDAARIYRDRMHANRY